MTDDTPNVHDDGLNSGAKSLIVGSEAGNWFVYPQINYGGNGKPVSQGKHYANPHEMGLQPSEVVLSLRKN